MAAVKNAPRMSFRDAVERHRNGDALETIFARIVVDTDLRLAAIRNAYGGTRVSPETAELLAEWAWKTWAVIVPPWDMVKAPPRKKGKQDEPT